MFPLRKCLRRSSSSLCLRKTLTFPSLFVKTTTKSALGATFQASNSLRQKQPSTLCLPICSSYSVPALFVFISNYYSASVMTKTPFNIFYYSNFNSLAERTKIPFDTVTFPLTSLVSIRALCTTVGKETFSFVLLLILFFYQQ